MTRAIGGGTAPPRSVRLRREAFGFMVGSTLFALGSIPAYANAVGLVWGSATFAMGSVFFTVAALIQLLLSGRRPPRRGSSRADWFDWWAAAIQFAGTLLFNVSTFAVFFDSLAEPMDPSRGWRPDAWGSIAFLLSSALAMVAAANRHELWDALARTWHGTWLNLIGSIAFAFSAVGAYVVPGAADILNSEWVNIGTFVGAVCFFTAALFSRRASVLARE